MEYFSSSNNTCHNNKENSGYLLAIISFLFLISVKCIRNKNPKIQIYFIFYFWKIVAEAEICPEFYDAKNPPLKKMIWGHQRCNETGAVVCSYCRKSSKYKLSQACSYARPQEKCYHSFHLVNGECSDCSYFM